MKTIQKEYKIKYKYVLYTIQLVPRRIIYPWRGQRRAGSIAGAMPHVRVAGVAQQQQLSSESSTSRAVVCAGGSK